ncbi:nuclear transport factor 2 family protein [Pseudonocardia dioxanivorans]|uniref:nuclear transport factor 2 family protein n=1 Tax=Pseudonocardia dioxanivorans TaxID=240495 RepID=UPI000CD2DD95|nr:nuclear transport factor 2 family protein [Pseudonocardia dioxanivorans]
MTPDLVRAFESAVNAADVDAAAALVTDDVEVGGPRGAARGVEVLRSWVAGSGISLSTVRFFGRGDVAVALQDARWIDDDSTRSVATEFTARDGRISRIVRHDDGLDAALAAAGLGEADEIEF